MLIPGEQMLRGLWLYRDFVVGMVLREFNGRYRESLLGGFWAIASPLTMLLIYTVIFSQLLRPTLAGHTENPFAFSIYLCAGVIPWSLFAEMLGRMTMVFLENGNLIKKSSFPRVTLPAIVTLSALINFAVIFSLYLIFLLLIGHWPGWVMLAVAPLLTLQVLFTVGLGVFLATLNVFFRDVGQLVGVVLQFWFWLTPIVYTLTALPERVQSLIQLNPIEPLIAAYQTVFLSHQLPDFSSLVPLLLFGLFFIVLGARFFLARVGELVDEL